MGEGFGASEIRMFRGNGRKPFKAPLLAVSHYYLHGDADKAEYSGGCDIRSNHFGPSHIFWYEYPKPRQNYHTLLYPSYLHKHKLAMGLWKLFS